MSEKPAKSSAATRVVLHHLMLPEHANALGNVHGGVIMKMVDEAGAICAMRHAQRPAVTVAIDSMTFRQPVHVGHLLSCRASVSYVGRSSIEVEVLVHAENPITGESTHTNSAYVVYVALSDDGKPCPVPQLLIETDDDRKAWEAARARQEHRLGRR
jgi:uncharacterized protein (TIGR00369 family)